MQFKNHITSIFAVTFVCMISLQMGLKSYMATWYILDNSSFEDAYCVNLDFPEIMCHGSCAIKSLSKSNTNDASVPNQRRFIQQVEYIMPVVRYEIFSLAESGKLLKFPTYIFEYQSPYLDLFLHPPC